MEQTLGKSEILDSKFKKETYLLRTRKRFQNIKHYAIKKRYKDEENELTKRVTTIFKRLGWIKEGRR